MNETVAAQLLFALYALVVLAGGLLAVLSRNLVRAMVGLVLTLFGVAGMYLLLNTPFMAFMQILIYVGAVVVLIFFAIMLTRSPAGGEEAKPRGGRQALLAALAGLAPAAVLGAAVLAIPQAGAGRPAEIPLAILGEQLLTRYVLAFELISVVLFVAMAGAVLLGFTRRKGQ
ncbi:MAG: NADH-quinone oxidoreductase subunit J [Thermodesulfobacteriota bacterium]